MKAALRESLSASGTGAAVLALVPLARIIERGSVTDKPTTPFIVLAGAGRAPGMGEWKAGNVEFWVHDDRGTYHFINQIIATLIVHYDGLIQFSGTDADLLSVEYQSDSPDLEDDGYRTNTRSVAFRVVARPR